MNELNLDRRKFLTILGASSFVVGILGIQSCEKNIVEPLTLGEEISFITPNSKFFYKNGADVSISNWKLPDISKDSWVLKIDGLVGKPLEVKFSDLLAEESNSITMLKTIRCVIDSNDTQGLIGNAIWKGIPLKIFLDKAGVDSAKTKRFRLYGSDTFTNNIKYDRLYSANNPKDLIQPLLVYEMNGLPLTPEHGFPVRLIVLEGYGFKNVKWISRVEATDKNDEFGTYQDTGFIDDGVIRTNSRMTYPVQNAQVVSGAVRLSGFAVSGSNGIKAIEISVDDGTYQIAKMMSETELKTSISNDVKVVQINNKDFTFPYRGVWIKWSADLTLSPGSHLVKIRATDLDGNIQPDSDNDNSDGINAISTISIKAI
ncbi:MAG: molybdopterin-dependent oxidoreductase [Chlorobi bacterium]|nr:molybdopterin-dependent oxidoreductase [Chlorobiota bacterium]